MHALVLFLPYFGARSPRAQLPLPAAPTPPHVFTATLAAPRPGIATAKIAENTVGIKTPALPVPSVPAPEAQPLPERSAGLDLLPIPAPAYYTTDQLTKRPQPVVLAELDTRETLPIVASGKLVLKLWIDDQGSVSDAIVEKTDLPEVFSRAAIVAFKRSSFQPGERGGLRVGTVMRIEISYDDGRTLDR